YSGLVNNYLVITDLRRGTYGSVLEEAALVFGLAHLRLTQNFACPNTSTTSSSTAYLVLTSPHAATLFSGWWWGMGCKRSSEQAKMSVNPYPTATQKKSTYKKTRRKKNRSASRTVFLKQPVND
ncbi:MAG: hypothetical protein ACKOEU_01960, partial [Limnohabitans sp.]